MFRGLPATFEVGELLTTFEEPMSKEADKQTRQASDGEEDLG